MPYMSYFVFLGLLLLCSIFSGWASMRVHSSYNAFSAQKNASHMTGYDTAVRLLRANGVYDISVGKVKGTLTDHFDPKRQIVNLSDSTYGNDSVAAVAVAAHEIGHVMQKEKGYVPYKIRSALVPVVNIGARMAVPLVLVGLLLDLLLNFSSVGFYAAIAGIILYGLSTLFHLVTLPVEYNASARAVEWLQTSHTMQGAQLAQAREALSWAARTYLVAALSAIASVLYYVFLILGRRD